MSRPTQRQIQATLAFYAGEPLPEAPAPRKNARPEAAALTEVLKALRSHPAVAWCERQNTGAYKDGQRFIRYGWPGCSDSLGMLKDGRFLAVEVKAEKEQMIPVPPQYVAMTKFWDRFLKEDKQVGDLLRCLLHPPGNLLPPG